MNDFTIGEHVPAESDDEPVFSALDPWLDDEPHTSPREASRAVDDFAGFEPITVHRRSPVTADALREQLAEAERVEAEHAERERQRREELAAAKAQAERDLVARVGELEQQLDALIRSDVTDDVPAYRVRAAARAFVQSYDRGVLVGCADDLLVELAVLHAEVERLAVTTELDFPSRAARVDLLERAAFSALMSRARWVADPDAA